MKSTKEVVAVIQTYVNTNIREVRLQFLCISSFQENGSNARETVTFFNPVYLTIQHKGRPPTWP